MNINSTVRAAILASALALVASAGAQAASLKDIENYGLSVAPGKVHSVHQVKDNDSLLYEVMIDGDDGATHTVKVDEAGKLINHTSRLNISQHNDVAGVPAGESANN